MTSAPCDSEGALKLVDPTDVSEAALGIMLSITVAGYLWFRVRDWL